MRYTYPFLEAQLIAAFLNWPHLLKRHHAYLDENLFTDPRCRYFRDILQELFDNGIAPGRNTIESQVAARGDGWVDHEADFEDLLKSSLFTLAEFPGMAKQLDIYRQAREAYGITAAVHGIEIAAPDAYLKSLSKAYRASITTRFGGDSESCAIKDACQDVLRTMQAAHDAGGGLLGPSWGFPELDKLTSGIRAKTLTIVGGRPAHGKTSLVLQMADGLVRAGKRVLFFSLEMPREELLMRLISQRTGINGINIQQARLTEYEWGKAMNEFAALSGSGWIIRDRAGQTIEQIEGAAYSAHEDEPINMVVVDYAQLVRHDMKEQRYRALGRLAETLYGMSKELEIPVILCSQLSRSVENAADRKPMLSDLRESGDLEQCATFVMFIHRPALQGAKVPKEQTELLLRKNRHGATGIIKAWMQPECTRFEEKQGGVHDYDD